MIVYFGILDVNWMEKEEDFVKEIIILILEEKLELSLNPEIEY